MRSLAILLTIVILTSGCLSNVEDTINPEKELFDDTIFIDEDEHMKLTWTIDSVRTIRINLDLLEGPNIDLYTMSETNYESYKDCEAFNYITQLSDPDTSNVNIEFNTDEGTYVTVIDNTDCGDAQPPEQGSGNPLVADENDRARVEYRITAQ
ncbi:MAG: hypothetical protein CMA58_01790 [Euryarchaeota archaeon]|jgi:uncharacterized protein YceK|nr:hypothetical protein [Euryarchaeota archaeon]